MNKYDKAFEILVKDGTIYKPPYDAIFDFVDAVLKNKVNLAFDLLQQAYAVGENTMTLITVLYTNIKQLLQVQSCQSKDISKSTGLDGWQIKNAKSRCGYYTNDDLLYFLSVLRKCEKGIKIGTMEEQHAMEYILINIF